MSASTKPLLVLAKLLLIGNLVVLVTAYFGMPAYQKMHPSPNGVAEFIGFEILTAIDMLAAALILNRWFRAGIGILAITSSIWCGYSIFIQLQAGRSAAPLWTLVIGYWDVVLLAYLGRKQLIDPLPEDARQ